MAETNKAPKWVKDVKGQILTRQVVGFGHKVFKLDQMTAEEVERWEARGVDFSPFKEREEKKAGEEPKQSKEERTKARIEELVKIGFERVENKFTRGEDKVTLNQVETMGAEKFAQLLEGFAKQETEEPQTDGKPEGAE